MVRMVEPNGNHDHVLDEVNDGDHDDDDDVNMQDNDAGERAAPPENNGSRNNQDIDEEPPLEGYQRYVFKNKAGWRAAYPWIPRLGLLFFSFTHLLIIHYQTTLYTERT